MVGLITLALLLARNSKSPVLLSDERNAEHQALVREREHSTRGRVFIETPIVQSQSAVLDSLSDDLAGRLTDAVTRSAVARAVPRDTVVAIESEAARQDGLNSPRQTLTRADAYVAVMTVLSVRDDSIHAAIVLERLVPPARLKRGTLARLFGRAAAPAAAGVEVIETFPLLRLTEPVNRPWAVVSGLSRALVIGLDEMRSCAAEKHAGAHSVPWCWRNENVADVVPGFYHARLRRARAVPIP